MNFSSCFKLACLSFLQRPFPLNRRLILCDKHIHRWISDMAPKISVTPRSSLMDRAVKICISGLKAHQRVTLHAAVVGDGDEVFESHAYYIANKEGWDKQGHWHKIIALGVGTYVWFLLDLLSKSPPFPRLEEARIYIDWCIRDIDVSQDYSSGGSYSGIEPMGFLWSMIQVPGQRKGLRLMKKDVTKPYIIQLNCLNGHLKPDKGFVNIIAQNSLQPVASAVLEKWYIGEGVQRIRVKEGRIRGTLFIPPGNGPFPGVIDLFGTAGGLNEHKASLLASSGFIVLSLAYFNFDDLPKFLPYCELEYFEEAAEWLVKHPSVISGGVGMMGVSKGAEIALMMAVHRKDIVKAIIPISTSYIISVTPFKVKGKLTGAYYDTFKARRSEDGGLILRECVPVCGLVKMDPPVVIPVEKIDCPVLIICGESDENVSGYEMAQEVLIRMKSNGKGDLCTVLSYPGTGHLIEPPFAPHCYESYHKLFKVNFVWGGNAKDHSKAQGDSWGEIKKFFKEHLSETHNSHL